MIPFHVDPSWYERYWWHNSAPRKRGIFAFFRRILSQQRLTRRQDVRADHQIPHSPSMRVATSGAVAHKTGILWRIIDAIVESRQKRADREIRRFLARSGGRLTHDDV